MFADTPKALARRFCRSTAFRWGVRAIESLPQAPSPLLRVLTYHRVDDVANRPDLDPSLISATPEQFAAQVRWFASEFDTVSLTDVLDAVDRGRPLPQRALLLTFDDAYRDFAEHAWPALRQWAVPATLFVPTGYPDQARTFWWDRLHHALRLSDRTDGVATPFGRLRLGTPAARDAGFRFLKQRLKTLPEDQLQHVVDSVCGQCHVPPPKPAVLGWGELRRLASDGVALVPHTHRHPLLDRVPIDTAREEISRSRKVLAEQVGEVPAAFAYPSGHYTPQVREIVRQAGFQLAFTTVRGVNPLQTLDPHRVRRINISRHAPEALIRLRLAKPVWLNKPLPSAVPGARGADAEHRDHPSALPAGSTVASAGEQARLDLGPNPTAYAPKAHPLAAARRCAKPDVSS